MARYPIRGGMYLMGLSALLAGAVVAQQAGDPAEAPVVEEAGSDQPEPAAPAADTSTPTDLSSDELLESFQRERPQAMPVQPRPNEGEVVKRWSADDMAGAQTGGRRMPDGYYLRDRTGRAVRDGEWWVLHSVSDNHPDKAPEPPVKLLPNQLLERLVRETQGGAVNYEFIVSGEVTNFLGENYLLLRKLMRKRDLGNIRR